MTEAEQKISDRNLMRKEAERIANITIAKINQLNPDDTPTMPYKRQWILEEVVELLKKQI